MISYTDNIPEGFGGVSYGPYIRIRPKYRDDKPLLAHERCHQAQMARVGTLTFWWRYLTSKAFRQASEVEAYKVQAQYYADDRRLLFASYIAKSYRLNITTEDAYKLLTRD